MVRAECNEAGETWLGLRKQGPESKKQDVAGSLAGTD